MLGIEFPDQLQAAQGLIGPRTHTGIGGWADLRNRYGASKAHTDSASSRSKVAVKTDSRRHSTCALFGHRS